MTVRELDIPTITREEERRRDVLLKAAEVIEKKGHVSGSSGMWVGNGKKCLLGAVGEAMSAKTHCGSYSYIYPARLIGVDADIAYKWSDHLRFKKMPRTGGPLSSRMSKAEVVGRALRRLANGQSWAEATRL